MRVVITVALAAFALGFAGIAGGAGAVDFVTGAGERSGGLAGGTVRVEIEARSGPAGESAQGHLHLVRTTSAGDRFETSGTINCLTVIDNAASARGVIEKNNNPVFSVGDELLLEVTDEGSPGKGQDSQVNLIPIDADTGQPISGCPILPYPEALFALTQGNFVVRDS